MRTLPPVILCIVLMGFLQLTLTPSSQASIYYVSSAGNDGAAGSSWATAKLTIQAAVDISSNGDTVLVTNGVYATGGRVVSGSMTNRVAITNAITVRSVNGPSVTVIRGSTQPGTTNGDAAVRCAYVGGSATLSGFTLTNGATRAAGNPLREQSGGGVWCVTNGLVFNCVLAGNSAQNNGGGAYSGQLEGCLMNGNIAYTNGGGAFGGTLNNCLLTGNIAYYGGGSYTGSLNNCTLRGNTALYGGGSCASVLNNCIVYNNTAVNGANSYSCTLNYCCTTPNPGGNGNITGAPQFVGPNDSHLATGSPCINAGTNAYVQGSTDLDGQPRIMGGRVDMGAYESLVTLTVMASDPNAGNVAGSGIYVPGTNVVFSFTPRYPWVFTGWNDGVTDLIRMMVMPDSNVTYTASAVRPVALWYVATNGNDSADGSTWVNAKRTIQAAVDLAIDNDTVLVSNGVYSTGGSTVAAYALTNRVAITNAITVRSVNGPSFTTIQGAWHPGVTNGPGAVRCVYLGGNARLSGFTLSGGATASNGELQVTSGGGVWCEPSAQVSNCVITGNSAAASGGGAYNGAINNCTLTCNTALEGGGVAWASLTNCFVAGNAATSQGGGGFIGWMTHCTVVNNRAPIDAGVSGYDLLGCIIYYNNNSVTGLPDNRDLYVGTVSHCCTTPANWGTNIITNEPLIASLSNPHLLDGSPCIDAGTNVYASGTDIDGQPRIANGIVDIGCDERTLPLGGPLAVSFVKSTTFTYIGHANAFEAMVQGIPRTLTWNWGDGTVTTNLFMTSHVYAAAGVYAVTLTTSNDSGSTSAMIMVQVNALPVHYVSLAGAHISPYTNWGTAATDIQSAIDAATVSNAIILVSNGVYATGGRVVDGAMSNRVAITKPVTVRSLKGPAVTLIRGAWNPVTTNGDAAVRCAYVTDGAVLSGFTLTNGATRSAGYLYTEMCGGGVWNETNAVIKGCILVGNSAERYGGGSYGGTLINCVYFSNTALWWGGGAFEGKLYSCTLTGNSASTGGGCYVGIARNCIAYFNSAPSFPNMNVGMPDFCCTTPKPTKGINITNAPLFAAANDYHLSSLSPCINAGINDDVSGPVDLDGYPRIIGGTVDIGAHEFFGGYSGWAALVTNGLTNDIDCATGDGYPNLLKYATGSSPTNGDTLARLEWEWTNDLFWVRFNRNPESFDVTLVVECSDALTANTIWKGLATNVIGSWGGATNVIESGAGTPAVVKARDVATSTNKFFRLHVTRP